MRSDPVLRAAWFIHDIRQRAVNFNCLSSVGIINAFPGSVNTIPEKVVFSLDLRSRDDSTLDKLEMQLQKDSEWKVSPMKFGLNFDPKKPEIYRTEEQMIQQISDQHCRVEWQTDSISHAVKFDESCIQCVKDSVKDSFGDATPLAGVSERMVSGAGAYLNLCFYPSLLLGLSTIEI